MWCKQCRQDVPAVASERGGVRCVRCRNEIEFSPTPHRRDVAQFADFGLPLEGSTSIEDATKATMTMSPPPAADSLDDLDDWNISAELQRIRRRFDASSAADHPATAVPAPHVNRFTIDESGRPQGASRHRQPLQTSAAHATNVAPGRKRRRASPLVWCMLSLGLMAFVCGGVLLGWSLATGRADLWSLGMPITLGGQFALLLGLLLQLEGLWEGNRNTVDKLDEVDVRLDDLKQTAALLSSSHSSPAQAFYVHMAGGASPHLLLADLKGQLDLLAVQMAKSR